MCWCSICTFPYLPKSLRHVCILVITASPGLGRSVANCCGVERIDPNNFCLCFFTHLQCLFFPLLSFWRSFSLGSGRTASLSTRQVTQPYPLSRFWRTGHLTCLSLSTAVAQLQGKPTSTVKMWFPPSAFVMPVQEEGGSDFSLGSAL